MAIVDKNLKFKLPWRIEDPYEQVDFTKKVAKKFIKFGLGFDEVLFVYSSGPTFRRHYRATKYYIRIKRGLPLKADKMFGLEIGKWLHDQNDLFAKGKLGDIETKLIRNLVTDVHHLRENKCFWFTKLVNDNNIPSDHYIAKIFERYFMDFLLPEDLDKKLKTIPKKYKELFSCLKLIDLNEKVKEKPYLSDLVFKNISKSKNEEFHSFKKEFINHIKKTKRYLTPEAPLARKLHIKTIANKGMDDRYRLMKVFVKEDENDCGLWLINGYLEDYSENTIRTAMAIDFLTNVNDKDEITSINQLAIMSPEQEDELELELNVYLEDKEIEDNEVFDLLNEIKRIYIYLRNY